MKLFVLRLIKRSVLVVAALAAIGCIYGRILYTVMTSHTTNPPEEAAEILWRAPVTLAAIGFVFLVFGELLSEAFRRRKSSISSHSLKKTAYTSVSEIPIPPPPTHTV
jgi:hypothetical protein